MLTMTEQLSPCGALISFLAIIEFARHRLSHESAKTVGPEKHFSNITLIKAKIKIHSTYQRITVESAFTAA